MSVLLVTLFTITSFDIDAFAEKLTIQSPELSLGSNHLGSMIKTQTVSSDGSVWIFVAYTNPVEREHMTVNVRFTDKNGQEITNVNYDIMVSQNDQVILDETMVNHQIGIRDHLTQELPSSDNVIIKITLQGIGTVAPFTGPQGETIQVNVVPEFGTIVMMILAVSIISIIGISAKSKLMMH
ncbi:MAG: PEFG-CTERM sorting domain-containing protein [Nitrosopumilus sp.]|nr:PEFG-CTERM sorting domain-containing protein [Nitrosopumilus sp.]